MNNSMKKWRTRLVLLPIAALLMALWPGAVLAATTEGGQNVNVKSGQVIHDDLYLGGSNVNMNGIVTGNLIAGGGNVNVNGRVDGTILAAGGNVTLNGSVGGSVLVAAGNLDVVGHVGRDVTLFGGNVHLQPGSVVGRDVLSVAGMATVQGTVERNLRVLGRVDLRSGAVIGGNLNYRGPDRPAVPAGVVIHGTVKHQPGDIFFDGSGTSMPWNQGPWFLGWLRTLVGLLALGLVFVWLAPKFSRTTITTLETRWIASLAWGVVTLVATPILAVVIFIGGLWIGGWWLGLFILFCYLVALVLAVTMAGLAAVAWATTRAERPIPLWAAMITGIVTMTLVGVVPYVGWIVVLIGLLWALGGMTITLFQRSTGTAVWSETARNAARDDRKFASPTANPVT